jgi:hypothetical protein
MSNINKHFLAFCIIVALSFEFSMPMAQAEASSQQFFYGGTKNIVIKTQFMPPWIEDKKANVEEIELLKNYEPFKTGTIESLIQNLTADYVRKHLDEKLSKCIDVVLPNPGIESHYESGYWDLFLAITYVINPADIDGKKNLLASLYIIVTRPRSSGSRQGLYNFIPKGSTPTYAIILGDDLSTLRSNFSIAIDHLLKRQIDIINTSNFCKG